MPRRKFITALYGRTSKDDPRRVTIKIQQTVLREWSLRDDFVENVVDEYWDGGVSGKLPLSQRPEGKRLLADVDRFGRTLLDGLLAAAELEKAGVKVVAGGKIRAMDRDNAPPGGPLTFGYQMNSHGQYILDPIEAPIVIRVFEMTLSGMSNPQIATWLRTTNALPGRKYQKRTAGSLSIVAAHHRNSTWKGGAVARILNCKTYLGIRMWAGREFPCPPLIDRETFDKVQVVCNTKGRRFGAITQDDSKGLVSGLFKCGLCGSPFYHKPTVHYRKNGKVVRYQKYVCYGQRRNCQAKMLNVAEVDEFVWKSIMACLENPEQMVQKAIGHDSRLGEDANTLTVADQQLSCDLASIDSEVAEVWAKLDELNRKRERLLKKQEEVRRLKANLVLDREQMSRIVAAVAHIRSQVNGDKPLSQSDRRTVVRDMILGGVIHTQGSGRHKTGTVHFNICLGEQVASPDADITGAIALPGMQMDATIPQTLTITRA